MKEEGKGWKTIGDVILYMPVCVFVKVSRVKFEVPGFNEFLNDPIQRKTYIRDLPDKFKIPLLYKRNYMHNVYGTIKLLSFMGLVFFDLTKKHIKTIRIEDTVIYVNQRASFLDTKISQKSWNKITHNLNYDRKMYHFTNLDEVAKYWHQLRDTCIKTPLGMTSERKTKNKIRKDAHVRRETFPLVRKAGINHRLSMAQKGSYDKVQISMKEEQNRNDYDNGLSQDENETNENSPRIVHEDDLVSQLPYDSHWPTTRLNSWFENEFNSKNPNNQTSTGPKDDGLYIPGDNLGAGGLDSSLFAHRRSSWLPPENRPQMHLFLNTQNSELNDNSASNVKLVDKDSRELAGALLAINNSKSQGLSSKSSSNKRKLDASTCSDDSNEQSDDQKEDQSTENSKESAASKSKQRKLAKELKEQKQKENEDLAKKQLEKRRIRQSFLAQQAKDTKTGQRCKFQETEDLIISRLQAANTFLFKIFTSAF